MSNSEFSIFAYSDYRLALKEFYHLKKRESSHFSHRYIAMQINCSPGFFSQIINGKTNISPDKILKFSHLLKLNSRETEYFSTLVHYNQTQDLQSRERLFEKLISLNRTDIRPLSFMCYEFYDKWYYSAVREAISIMAFKGNFKELANRLHPPISIEEAKSAIVLLEKLGLIHKNRNGFYERKDPFIKAGSPEHSFMLKKIVLSMMDLAKESIDSIDKDYRNLSWQTISVQKEFYPEIIEEIRAFRKRLMVIAQKSENPDVVYQINLQIFPLTK